MHRRVLSLLILWGSFLLHGQDVHNPTVAILDFTGKGVSETEASALTDRFSYEFFNLSQGQYILIERQQVGEILEEQGFQMSGCVASECAVEAGQALGAQFIITGSILKVGNVYSVNARMFSVETTEIINSITYDQVGTIGELLLTGMRESAAKMLNTSVPEMPTTGSLKFYAEQSDIELYNPDTGEFLFKATIDTMIIDELNPGTYSLYAKKEGYKPQVYKYTIVAGRTSTIVIPELPRLIGTISFSTNADPAQLFIDGELVGETPLDTALYYSQYRIEVRKKGYDEKFSSLVVGSKQDSLKLTLIKTLPSLIVSLYPEGSFITLNDTTIQLFYQRTFRLGPNSYHLKAFKEGYDAQEKTVDLTYGDTLTEEFSLKPVEAKIQFYVNAPRFTIQERNINGQVTIHNGEWSSGYELTRGAGSYRFKLNAKKYYPKEFTVGVINSGIIAKQINLEKKSSTIAMQRSLLLPGIGQLYAESNKKALIMATSHFVLAYNILLHSSVYHKHRNKMNLYYNLYKHESDPDNISFYHNNYKVFTDKTNKEYNILLGMGITLAINWIYSVIDAKYFSGL